MKKIEAYKVFDLKIKDLPEGKKFRLNYLIDNPQSNVGTFLYNYMLENPTLIEQVRPGLYRKK